MSPRMSGHEEWAGLLDPDEKIIWQGAPTGRFRLEFDSLFGVLFMIVWAAIPTAMVIASPAALLLGVPALFLGIALWFFVGQHFWAMALRRRTFYSLSSKRAFIAKRMFTNRKLESYPITPETVLELDDRQGGSIWFAKGQERKMFSNNTEQKIGFDQLADPRQVYALMRQVQQGTL